jgi:hypothetical protein
MTTFVFVQTARGHLLLELKALILPASQKRTVYRQGLKGQGEATHQSLGRTIPRWHPLSPPIKQLTPTFRLGVVVVLDFSQI